MGLLLDAAYVLDSPDGFHRANEIVQSCVRGALDSVLKLAGEDFPGPRRAARSLAEAAGAVADSWTGAGTVPPNLFDSLVAAVDEVRAQDADHGGFRVRQVEHLVLEQTRQEIGLAERQAARDSWSAFYSSASAVLHGSSSAGDARQQFGGAVAAMQELFLGLPERADRLRKLALLDSPGQRDADEVARMTDPRAGAYFFRAAVSDVWLELLPLKRLLPEERRWPAAPYMRRLLAKRPKLVCAWVEERLEDIAGQGAGALSQAVAVVAEGGMAAGALVARVVQEHPERYVLIRAAYWAYGVPVSERNGQWVTVVERVLGAREFAEREEWERRRLLGELSATAHPEGRLRSGKDRLGVIIRSSLAGVLAGHLAREDARLHAELCSDLGAVGEGESVRSAAVAVMRAVLDLALAEARLGVPVGQRLRGVRGKPVGVQFQDRLVAVHLAESFAVDAEAGATAAWWQEALRAAGQVGGGKWPYADVADFVTLVGEQCPEDLREAMEDALAQGFGTPPSQEEISAWEEVLPEPALPDAWYVVRGLSPVLPAGVLAGWQPVLAVLQERFGAPPARPEPVVKISSWVESYGGLSIDTFAARVQAEGPAAAVAELAVTVVPRQEQDEEADGTRAWLLGDLVAQNPAGWAVGAAEVAAAAGRPALQAAYFNALHRAAGDGGLDTAVVVQVAQAAFAVRPSERSEAPGAAQLERVISNLLHRTWSAGESVGAAEAEAVAWLSRLVEDWTVPRQDSSSPMLKAVEEPGGSALLSLISWGLGQARDGNGLPEPVAYVLDPLLTDEPDDQALGVIGLALSQLCQADSAWTDRHADSLLTLDTTWRPARSWLVWGHQPDHQLLARLERSRLWDVLSGRKASGEGEGEGPLDKTMVALLQESMPLGRAEEFLAGLAGRPGGAEAISTMLSRLATAVDDAPEDDSEWARRQTAGLWRAALDAQLPPEALRGAGHFAFTKTLDEDTWLELTARTVAQQPDLNNSDHVTKRAARTPGSAHAQVIAARALDTAPGDGYRRAEIIHHAADVFAHAASGTPQHEDLRIALINAGAIEAAYDD
ncbi:hypothetical protein NPS70_27995 [Streptomyces sp. C10-9-1]|uniref:hypothetical protein n=1 Tax=Streptomyces sp. C10-9-1 TaxID=1859285 RepID=UPI0021137069|nr:hypothetical protein [Streptomyces sp. C10-9-1]MCQ6556998.1 hypothetical protein [Streptomyces sp. C10-9-1]